MTAMIPLNSTVGIACVLGSAPFIQCMSIDPSNGDVYFCGGLFTSVNSVARTLVACVTRNGLLKTWAPTFGAGSSVNAILVTSAGILIGGNFTTVNGVARTNLAMVDNTGALTSWVANANGQVFALATDGTNAYIGGNFTTIASTAVQCFGAISLTGTIVTTLSQAITAATVIYALACDSAGFVYAGGLISTVQTAAGAGHSATVSNACQLNPAAGWATAWNPNANNTVFALAADTSNAIYLAGAFTSVLGTTRNHLAQVTGSTPTLGSWAPTASTPPVTSFTIQYSLLAIGTDVYWSTGISGAGFTGCMNGTTSIAWDPIVNSFLLCLAYDSGNPVASAIWVGGQFFLVLGISGGLITDNRENIAKMSTRATIPTRLMY